MHITVKKRCLVRIISFVLAGIAAVAGLFLQQNHQMNTLRRSMAHSYQQALEGLDESMESLSMTLEKSLYIGTAAGMSALTNRLILLSGNAGAALSTLPAEETGMHAIAKFLSQVGDYAAALTQKSIRSERITGEERESLRALYETSCQLTDKIDEIKSVYNSYDSWAENIDLSLKGQTATAGVSASIQDLERSLGEQPALIYDGPFSDHINQQEAELLKSATEVTRDQARQKAAAVIGCKKEQLADATDEDGTMPSYCFQSDNLRVAVTKKGGYISYFANSRRIETEQLEHKTVLEKAQAFVNGLGLGSFESSYYFTDEGVCTVNFSFKQGNLICYTDLIKVGVAMDNGQIVSLEARGYIMNHKPRTVPVEKLTEAQAQAVLSEKLQVQSVRRCLIPSAGNQERYCYEFHCLGEKQEDILVYINTENGAEEELLILLKTDGGTLTR